MGPLRPALLGALLLVGTAAAAERPSAVQLCFTLPQGVALFSPAPRANYRAFSADAFLLDLEVKLNGQAPERLTRTSDACLRAWLPAVNVSVVTVSFDRTLLGLAAQERKVDLKLKPDLWYDAGTFAVAREPWARVSSALPGRVTLEHLSSAGSVAVTDLAHVPAGTYRVGYEPPPPPTGPCRIALRVTGTGTIRADTRPAFFAEVVEHYRAELLPEVVKDQQLVCTAAEALEVSVRLLDGTFVEPRHPDVRRVTLPGREPRYALRLGASAVPFHSGQTVVIGAGQDVVLELDSEGPLAVAP
jgi:hypothetical protein